MHGFVATVVKPLRVDLQKPYQVLPMTIVVDPVRAEAALLGNGTSETKFHDDVTNAANGEKQTVEEYIADRMNEVADSYNAQRLSEAKERPEIQALVEKLAAVDKGKLAGIEAAIDASMKD